MGSRFRRPDILICFSDILPLIMATQKDIITLPNPHLRKKSVKIGFITEEVTELVKRMSEALLDWEDHREHEVGVALAAVQIDELKKVVIVRNDFENKEDRTFTVFINPVITKHEGKLVEDYEGCLSISNIYGKVPRYERVRVRAIDLEGREFTMKLEGFLARILQHEIDHTKGVVFVDHIRDKKDAFYRLEGSGELTKLDYDEDVEHSVLW